MAFVVSFPPPIRCCRASDRVQPTQLAQVIAAGDALGADVRLAAAVNFKNTVKYRWVSHMPSTPQRSGRLQRAAAGDTPRLAGGAHTTPHCVHHARVHVMRRPHRRFPTILHTMVGHSQSQTRKRYALHAAQHRGGAPAPSLPQGSAGSTSGARCSVRRGQSTDAPMHACAAAPCRARSSSC